MEPGRFPVPEGAWTRIASRGAKESFPEGFSPSRIPILRFGKTCRYRASGEGGSGTGLRQPPQNGRISFGKEEMVPAGPFLGLDGRHLRAPRGSSVSHDTPIRGSFQTFGPLVRLLPKRTIGARTGGRKGGRGGECQEKRERKIGAGREKKAWKASGRPFLPSGDIRQKPIFGLGPGFGFPEIPLPDRHSGGSDLA